MELKILDKFSKNSQKLNFMKTCPDGAQLFHTDGQTYRQTDMTKLIVAFLDFANTPKNQSVTLCTEIVTACCKKRKFSLWTKCKIIEG